MRRHTLCLLIIFGLLTVACRAPVEQVTFTPAATEDQIEEVEQEADVEESPSAEVIEEEESEPTATEAAPTAPPTEDIEDKEAIEDEPTATSAPPTATEVSSVQSIPIEFQNEFCEGVVSSETLQEIFQLGLTERAVNTFEQSGPVTLCQYRFENNSSANFAARLFQTPSDAKSFYDLEQAYANSFNDTQPLDGTWQFGFFNGGTVTLHFQVGQSYGVVEYVTAEQIDIGPPLYNFAQAVASNME